MDLTKDEVIAGAPDLAVGVTDDQFALAISDALSEIRVASWGGEVNAKRGARQLAAHFALLAKRRAAGGSGAAAAGPLIAVTVGKISKQYAAPVHPVAALANGDLDSTSYGLEYVRLRTLFCRRMATT